MRVSQLSRLKLKGIVPSPSLGGGSAISGAGLLGVAGYEARQIFAAPGVADTMTAFASIGKHLDADVNSEELLDVACISATAGAGTVEVHVAFLTPTSGPVRINFMAV